MTIPTPMVIHTDKYQEDVILILGRLRKSIITASCVGLVSIDLLQLLQNHFQLCFVHIRIGKSESTSFNSTGLVV